MTRLTPRHPSPAFALAAVALFVALGGTGYAATQGSGRVATAAKASKTSKPLTAARVDRLIKQYVNSHLSSLTGPAGATGQTGTPGSAGPAPIAVVGTGVSTNSAAQTIATVGPWTVKMSCTSPGASATVTGPGDELATTTIAGTNGSAGGSYESAGAPGGAAAVTAGSQISQVDFLSSDSTVYELKYNLQAATSGPDTDCTILGDAIKIS